MRRYDTLLLDADGTLFDFNLSEKTALKVVLSQKGIECGDNIISAYHKINAEQWRQLERGETTREKLRVDRFSRLIEYLRGEGMPNDIEAEILAGEYEDELARQGFLFDGALDVCRGLSRQCGLYIVTNGLTNVQRGRFSHSPIMHYVNKLYISEEIGAVKPDPAFFFAVLEDIGINDEASKSRTLVVGDSPSSDIAGGVNSGLDTCLYDPDNSFADICTPEPTYKINSLDELFRIVGTFADA
ncbi:MAG: YjjG family noncanonical pyrimidine nucleotidase [Clostridia bacterium]|nr:YjjG family noncanonical pyrimidine nucleotidase [Clostridia bacterium]